MYGLLAICLGGCRNDLKSFLHPRTQRNTIHQLKKKKPLDFPWKHVLELRRAFVLSLPNIRERNSVWLLTSGLDD
ncbi:hypothetical protein CSHISOI_04765 [Colletotrichum shisoi]|uniref:Uncharacterized protein n=1 Tax=Colletotrichum shisoi TaxID=2078593 RepID=A0A5Q4BUA7_9PEZI|nr:hypothetical protein CSHISOI_04765 [Colletotrichum shisoi]